MRSRQSLREPVRCSVAWQSTSGTRSSYCFAIDRPKLRIMGFGLQPLRNITRVAAGVPKHAVHSTAGKGSHGLASASSRCSGFRGERNPCLRTRHPARSPYWEGAERQSALPIATQRFRRQPIVASHFSLRIPSSPEFPVRLGGVNELHAAFLKVIHRRRRPTGHEKGLFLRVVRCRPQVPPLRPG
jgi:hypothetical protein